LKQLVRRVVKAGLRQFGCNDAPEQPDRKTEMLGENRPDEITTGDESTCGVPKLLVLRIPVRNPGRVPLAHQCVPFRLGIGPVNRRQQTPPPGARKRFSQGGGVACSVRDRRAAPAAATAWLRLYKLRANCGLRGQSLNKSTDKSPRTASRHPDGTWAICPAKSIRAKTLCSAKYLRSATASITGVGSRSCRGGRRCHLDRRRDRQMRQSRRRVRRRGRAPHRSWRRRRDRAGRPPSPPPAVRLRATPAPNAPSERRARPPAPAPARRRPFRPSPRR